MSVQPKPAIVRNVPIPASLEGVMNSGIGVAVPDIAINIIQHLSKKDLLALKKTSFSIRNAVAIAKDNPNYYKAKLESVLNTIPDLLPIAEELFRLQNPDKTIDYKQLFHISCDILFQCCPESVRNNPNNRNVKTFYTFENLADMRDIVIDLARSKEEFKKLLLDGVVADNDYRPIIEAILYGFSHNLNPEKYDNYADFTHDLVTVIENSSISDLDLLRLIGRSDNDNSLTHSVLDCILRKYTKDLGEKLMAYLARLSNLREIPASYEKAISIFVTLTLGDGAKRLEDIKALPEGDQRDNELLFYCERLLVEKKADQVTEVADLCSNHEFKTTNLQVLCVTLMKNGRTPEAKQILSEEEFDQLDRDLNLQNRSDQFLKEGKNLEAKECFDQIQTPLIQTKALVGKCLREGEFTTRKVRFECKWPVLFPLRIVEKEVYNLPQQQIYYNPFACERTIPFAIWLGVAFVVYSISMNFFSKRY